MRTTSRSPVVLVLAVAFLATACGGGARDLVVSEPATAVAPYNCHANWDSLMSWDDLADVVMFTDHFAVVTVVAEREWNRDNLRGDPLEGSIGRVVAMVTTDVAWTRPGAPALPTSFDTSGDAWALKDGVKRPLVFSGLWREVGQTYAVALTESATGFDWYQTAAGAAWPLDAEGRLTTPCREAVAVELAGRTPGEVAALLEATPIPDYAVDLMDLAGLERIEAVMAARAALGEPNDE